MKNFIKSGAWMGIAVLATMLVSVTVTFAENPSGNLQESWNNYPSKWIKNTVPIMTPVPPQQQQGGSFNWNGGGWGKNRLPQSQDGPDPGGEQFAEHLRSLWEENARLKELGVSQYDLDFSIMEGKTIKEQNALLKEALRRLKLLHDCSPPK